MSRFPKYPYTLANCSTCTYHTKPNERNQRSNLPIIRNRTISKTNNYFFEENIYKNMNMYKNVLKELLGVENIKTDKKRIGKFRVDIMAYEIIPFLYCRCELDKNRNKLVQIMGSPKSPQGKQLQELIGSTQYKFTVMKTRDMSGEYLQELLYQYLLSQVTVNKMIHPDIKYFTDNKEFQFYQTWGDSKEVLSPFSAPIDKDITMGENNRNVLKNSLLSKAPMKKVYTNELVFSIDLNKHNEYFKGTTKLYNCCKTSYYFPVTGISVVIKKERKYQPRNGSLKYSKHDPNYPIRTKCHRESYKYEKTSYSFDNNAHVFQLFYTKKGEEEIEWCEKNKVQYRRENIFVLPINKKT